MSNDKSLEEVQKEFIETRKRIKEIEERVREKHRDKNPDNNPEDE